MSNDTRAYALRQEAISHARQRVPLENMSHAAVLDEALSIVTSNLARALAKLEAEPQKEG